MALWCAAEKIPLAGRRRREQIAGVNPKRPKDAGIHELSAGANVAPSQSGRCRICADLAACRSAS